MQITLKAARINAGFTQKSAAKSIGVTVYTISNWERGKSFPSAPLIKVIEDTYKVRYDQLIFLPKNYAKSVN